MRECADHRLTVYRVATTGIKESEAQQLGRGDGITPGVQGGPPTCLEIDI